MLLSRAHAGLCHYGLCAVCISAFVPGCLITDNIISAYVCLHFMKRKNTNKNRLCALKLDRTNAYDKVEYDYLKTIMTKLGFAPAWISMVIGLVSSLNY